MTTISSETSSYKSNKGLDLIVVPDEMQLNVINHIHNKGPFGHKHSEELLNKEFFIPSMSSKIDKIIANCVTCLLYNRTHRKYRRLITSLT